MLVSCSKPNVEVDDGDDLEIILDGYILDPEISRKNVLTIDSRNIFF